MNSALYGGTLVHARRTPAENVFRYRISFFVLDLDEVDELERRLPLFSVNRPNVVALYDRDHFEDDGRSLKEKAVAFCAEPTAWKGSSGSSCSRSSASSATSSTRSASTGATGRTASSPA